MVAKACVGGDEEKLVWGQGDYTYDPARVAAFPLQPTGLVAWERVALRG